MGHTSQLPIPIRERNSHTAMFQALRTPTANHGCQPNRNRRFRKEWYSMKFFTWEDTVRIMAQAPAEARPGSIAEVCGIREIETSDQAKEFAAPIGTKLYLIEFGDGESIEIKEGWLEPVEA
jgi:hypothetical protein